MELQINDYVYRIEAIANDNFMVIKERIIGRLEKGNPVTVYYFLEVKNEVKDKKVDNYDIVSEYHLDLNSAVQYIIDTYNQKIRILKEKKNKVIDYFKHSENIEVIDNE